MTIFAERGPASKVLGSFSYKNALRVLPVEDLLHTDDGMTVRHAREALNATAKILNALLHNAPAGYPAEVRRELRNVMFHVRTALAQLDAYIGAGYYQDDSIDKVPGVESGIYNHLQALKGAKRQWGIWMALEKQEKKQGLKGFEELTGNTMASDILARWVTATSATKRMMPRTRPWMASWRTRWPSLLPRRASPSGRP